MSCGSRMFSLVLSCSVYSCARPFYRSRWMEFGRDPGSAEKRRSGGKTSRICATTSGTRDSPSRATMAARSVTLASTPNLHYFSMRSRSGRVCQSKSRARVRGKVKLLRFPTSRARRTIHSEGALLLAETNGSRSCSQLTRGSAAIRRCSAEIFYQHRLRLFLAGLVESDEVSVCGWRPARTVYAEGRGKKKDPQAAQAWIRAAKMAGDPRG